MINQSNFQATATGIPQIESSDEEYMAAVVEGDETAISRLYDRHKLLLRTIIARVLNSDSDADDLLQEIFVEIWNQAAQYNPARGKALGWIVTLTRRRAIDRSRRKQAYKRVEDRLRNESNTSAQTPGHLVADHGAVSTDRTNILKAILQTLPVAQRDVLHFSFYLGMSQREIALKTGIPLGTIKTRIDLALQKVRKAVLSLGGVQEWTINQA
jgi:RNA polymerase sigma-70 factor (ECF subfamily)